MIICSQRGTVTDSLSTKTHLATMTRRSGVHWLPLSVAITMPLTFVITYATAALLGHTTGFPYISDTGRYSPESSIFSLCLNVVAVLFALTCYVRYKQIQQYYEPSTEGYQNPDLELILRRNKFALILGWIATFGLMIVSNFRSSDVQSVHKIGALFCFIFGPLYCWFQTSVSYYMIPLVNSKRMAHTRLALCFIMTISFVVSLVCGILVDSLYHTTAVQDHDGWTDGQDMLYLNSTANEWILAISYDLFIVTFVAEMHKVSLSPPECRLLEAEVSGQRTVYESTQAAFEATQARDLAQRSSPENKVASNGLLSRANNNYQSIQDA